MAAGIIDPLPQQAQAVAIGRSDYGHLKDRQPLLKFFLLTYCAGRWQSTSWLCYCLTKSRTRSPGNHHTIGITAHVDCMEHSSLDESMCFHGSGTRAGFDPRCSDSPMRRYFQCIIIQKSTLIFSGCSFGPLAQLVRATGS